MNIGIIGYGKMGEEIEKTALQNGHKILFKINSKNTHELNSKNISKVDVAVEFSTPNTAFNNIYFCLNNNTPVVSGTTGWTDRMREIQKLCATKNGAFLYAENFSIGMYLFLEINKYITRLIDVKSYNIDIEETHHKNKKDAPSGTAIKIANDISNTLNKNGNIAIKSNRIGEIKGEHIVKYSSEIDSIQIKHTAHNRKGFAKGIILASEFIQNKKGVFSMKDIIKN